ncbi:hypothetical protein C8R48DRAFT_742128 [Suillus tomentosus]|nr:hypothetical protein C8R48DRAFT_742128 [Suillus tomentosus]
MMCPAVCRKKMLILSGCFHFTSCLASMRMHPCYIRTQFIPILVYAGVLMFASVC